MASVSRWQDRKESQLQDPRGLSQMGRLSPCRAPASHHHVHKGARWGANLGHSLCRPPSVSCQGLEWSGEARPRVPSTGCSGQCHCLKLLCTGLPGPLELGLAAVLQSSSSAGSLPVGATKIMQRPLQCSPCGIMAEQSWGHRPSSPVCDDGPRPGCSVGAPGQVSAISTREPPGTPGPRRSRSGIDPGERGHLELWPPSREGK